MLGNRKKSAVKQSIEKYILLIFVNMSPIISPRLSEETLFSFLTQFRPLESKFSADFSISKEPFFLDPLSANAQNG